MIQVKRLLQIGQIYETKPREFSSYRTESPLFENTDEHDTEAVIIPQSEKFADVKRELDKNIPDRTTTIEEKVKALSYIDRMLKCDDITPDLKNYWTNKKNVIEMEIVSIKNEQKIGTNEKWSNIEKDFSNFTDKYWVKNVLNNNGNLNNLEFNDAQEYYNTVRRTMITFCDRILACPNLPNDKKEYYTNLKNEFKCDLNIYATDSNNYNKAHNRKTESFNNVFTEMKNNLPSSTSTINEKKLALSYIDRMLSCDDIPNPEYWQNKKDIIEMEIATIKNTETTQKDNSTTSFKKVLEEYNDFVKEYWNKNPKFDNIPDRVEYWVTYNKACQSFIQRILDCNDLPNNMRENYTQEYANHQRDLTNQLRDLERYKQEKNNL